MTKTSIRLGGAARSRRKFWQIAIAPLVVGSVAVLYWIWPPRSSALDPAVIINVAATTVMATTGLLLWVQTEGVLRSISWTRHWAIRVAHEIVGLVYFPIVLLVDFYEPGDGQIGGEPALMEALNKPVMILTLLTAMVLYFRWPRPLLRYHRPIRYLHVTVASLWVLKFFLEPLFGGQLG